MTPRAGTSPDAAQGLFPSRFAFLMAAIASAIGLGNFWRFPYIAGEHGGGAFVVIYLACTILIATPLLIAEYAMGRKSGMSAIDGVYSLARAESQSRDWGLVAWTGTLTAFFILTFYTVVSTWLIAYFVRLVTDGLGAPDAASAVATANATIGGGEGASFPKWRVLTYLALFLMALVFVVGRRLHRVLERAAVFAMPALFLMLIILMFAGLGTAEGPRALAYLFEPDWSNVGFKTVLAALGQCFFSIGIGISLMMTYGAYLDRKTNIPAASVSVAGLDTILSLIAALAFFPFVFAAGLPERSGPELFFLTLPAMLEAMPGGTVFAAAFLLLALFAAFTSSVALIEVAISWLEERPGVTRKGAALGLGVILFMFGAAYVFSPDYFAFVDFIIEGVLLPLGGLLVAIFAGWVLSREMLISEIGEGALMNVWRFAVRWLIPLAIASIFVLGLADKLQDGIGLPMPALLTGLIGPNP